MPQSYARIKGQSVPMIQIKIVWIIQKEKTFCLELHNTLWRTPFMVITFTIVH